MIQQKAFDFLDAPIKRITSPDVSAPYSAELFEEWYPKVEQIIEAAQQVTYKQ